MSVLSRLASLELFGVKLGLDNIHALLAGLGHPERAWRAVHVAGTNGKGSVTAMVEAALRAAGHHTGRYTSPHLDRLEERFGIDGVPVDTGTLEAVAADVFDVIDSLRRAGTLPALPTFFEATTAIAFEIFRRARVDVAVVEVGLGGRFDATNVLSPAVTAVTSIALDHELHLGRTLAGIAAEKAGIARAGVPMVVGAVPAEAHAVIAAACAAAGARLVDAHALVDAEASMDDGVSVLRATTPVRAYPPTRLALRGRHQVANAIVAVRVLECCDAAGIHVSADAVVAGLSRAAWPARLEWLRLGAARLLIDAAHNPAGASALADYVRDAGIGPVPVVLGMMADKDVDGILRALVPIAASIVATRVPSARSLAASDLAEAVALAAPGMPVAAEPDPDEAVRLAWRTSATALAAGSIYLIGPLRARLLARGATPE